MQRIDVLRYDRDAAMFGFKTGEGKVCRIRLDALVRAPPRIVEGMNARRIEQEAFRRCNLSPIIFRPDTVRVAERRNTAFSG